MSPARAVAGRRRLPLVPVSGRVVSPYVAARRCGEGRPPGEVRVARRFSPASLARYLAPRRAALCASFTFTSPADTSIR